MPSIPNPKININDRGKDCARPRSSLKKSGRRLPAETRGIWSEPYTSDFGRETASRFFEARTRPTAIFASSDYVALGVLNAAHRAELHIPDSLSLIGFDDMPLAELLQPPLTTVRQSARDLGAEGTRVLLDLVAGKPVKRTETRLPVELIKRSSVRKRSSSGSILKTVPARRSRRWSLTR